MITGKSYSQNQPFRKKLLSEYDPEITLEKYVSYFELKDIIREYEKSPQELKTEIEYEFFRVLNKSQHEVESFLAEEDGKLLRELQILRGMTEDDLRNKHESSGLLYTLWQGFYRVVTYRELNCIGIRTILQKFADRCTDSPQCLAKIHAADIECSKSVTSLPPYDISRAMDLIVSALAVVSKQSFEQALKQMQMQRARKLICHQRIPPISMAYHFRRKTPFRPTPGSFRLHVISGTASPGLTKMVARVMKLPPTQRSLSLFPNGEVSISIDEPIRGSDCFIVQSLNNTTSGLSMSTVLMQLLLMIQTAMLSSARRITAVIPYLAYTHSRAEISLVAELLILIGCRHIITVDMYREQVEGLFGNVPLDNLSAKHEFVKYLVQLQKAEGQTLDNIVVVAPNAEMVARAQHFADALRDVAKHAGEEAADVGFAAAVWRKCTQKSEVPDVVGGNVAGKLCIIIDGVLNEGHSLVIVARELHRLGASEVKAVVTHALFCGDCPERIIDSPIDELIVSDSVNQDDLLKNSRMAAKLRIISIAPLLAEAIERVHTDNSLTTFFGM